MTNNLTAADANPLFPAIIAIRDFAESLANESDSSIDDAQLHADAIFDLLDDDDRTMLNDPDNFANFTDLDLLPLPLLPTLTDPLDRDAYAFLLASYTALLNARP